MQRQLHRSLRHLCYQRCRRRLYSAQAAAVHHLSSEVSTEQVAASSVGHTRHEPEEAPLDSEKGTTKSARKSNQLLFPPDSEDRWSAPNKVDAYLASLRAEGIEPTLKDLLRLTPKKIPSVKSLGYASAYKKLVDRLCLTFSKEQLRRFCQELGMDHRYSRSMRKKVDYAEAIMEREWGWENLKEVEKRRRDASEIVIKSFPVSASELFLLLGKDGSELLQISRDYNVHISVKPDPLSIKIEGFRASIKKLEVMIAERRKSIIEEKTDLPTGEPLSPGLLQQVSRTANAFIENVGRDGKIRIRANSQQRLTMAKRLVLRAAAQIRYNLDTPFIALLPPPPSALPTEDPPSSYALFPFCPQRSLPWTNVGGVTFRSRQVTSWMGGSNNQIATFSADLSGRRGRLVTMDGETLTLEDVITQSFQNTEGPFLITASTGHVLILAASQRHPSSIVPPLAGCRQYSELLEWMKHDNADRIFVPCLPSPLHSAPPTQEKIVHRLTYRLVRKKLDSSSAQGAEFDPVNLIRAEVIINRQKLEEPESPNESFDSESQQGQTSSELDDLFINEPVDLDSHFEGHDKTSLQSAKSSCDAVEDTGAAGQGESAASKDPSSEQSEGFEASSDNEGDSSREDDGITEAMNASTRAPEVELTSAPTCHRGRELELLVALPDRPMDLKLTVLGSTESVPIHTTPELQKYFEALRTYLDNTSTEPSPPEPPLFIEDGDDRYILDLNASIRQSTEALNLHASQESNSLTLDGLASRHISTITESIYDLESGQKLVNCQIACKAKATDEGWISFVEDIDLITSLGYKSKQTPVGGNFFSLDDHTSDEDSRTF